MRTDEERRLVRLLEKLNPSRKFEYRLNFRNTKKDPARYRIVVYKIIYDGDYKAINHIGSYVPGGLPEHRDKRSNLTLDQLQTFVYRNIEKFLNSPPRAETPNSQGAHGLGRTAA